MDQNEYPRPDYASGPYGKDKSWGIAIIIFSILGMCLGGLAVAGGGIMSAVGVGGAVAPGQTTASSAALGAGGGMVMLLGGGLLLLSIIRLVGGIGILGGKKWGFLVTAIVSGLLILMNLASLPSGLISIAINGIILYFCYSRLSGKEGPTPV